MRGLSVRSDERKQEGWLNLMAISRDHQPKLFRVVDVKGRSLRNADSKTECLLALSRADVAVRGFQS